VFARRDFGPPPLRDAVEGWIPPREAPPARAGRPSAADTGPQRSGAPAQRGEARPSQWRAGPGPGEGGRRPEQRGAEPATASPGNWSYSDQIRSSELVPTRKIPPARGWRRAVLAGSFGLINLGQSPDERRQAELEAKVRSLLRGHYKIGVLGKGGTGKTTIAASVGSLFAELRQEDRVVAIDADTAFGKLGSRIDPNVAGSYWELAADQHLNTFADMRTRVGNNTSGLFVLSGETSTARRRVLDAAIYREATSRLDNHFTISIIDCGSTMDSPVTQEVLLDLDALIVVSSPWVDGASAAGQTMDWLADNGFTGLLHRTVVVLNDSDGHADRKTRATLTDYFSRHGQTVIELPFDGHLRPGGVIDIDNELDRPTRRRLLEIAAAIAEHFPATTDASRDRR
jgi:MinD-like ATPase involved in chromosome partitioning or flagellar assembly